MLSNSGLLYPFKQVCQQKNSRKFNYLLKGIIIPLLKLLILRAHSRKFATIYYIAELTIY